jgi:hypothetical protein
VYEAGIKRVCCDCLKNKMHAWLTKRRFVPSPKFIHQFNCDAKVFNVDIDDKWKVKEAYK